MTEPRNKKLSNKKHDSSHNSHYYQTDGKKGSKLPSAKKRILDAINRSDHLMKPKEIAIKADVNRSTTRDYVRRLLKEGAIKQPYPGMYCSKIIHGMMREPAKCQNLSLGFSAPYLRLRDPRIQELRKRQRGRFVYEFEEKTGDVKIRVQFGTQRRKITGVISCGPGMDKNACELAVNRFLDICEDKTGRPVESFRVLSFEMINDVSGVRIDGVAKCYTKKSLFGALERIYQKNDFTVRHEFKVSQPMTIDQFTALTRGGVSDYNTSQALFYLAQEMRSFTEAQKWQNGRDVTFDRFMKALMKKWEREEKEVVSPPYSNGVRTPVEKKGRPCYVV